MKDVNKYKIVSLILTVALLATMARLVYSTKVGVVKECDKTDIVINNILSRRSVRSFSDQPVSRSRLDTLVRAAMAAPSGRDMRPWKFVVIDDRAVMDSLAKKLPYAKMLAEARAAIVVCGDLSMTDDEGKSSVNWTFDCSAATENLLLSAEAMGLGAVWTGVYPYEDRLSVVSSTLNLPDHIIPLNVIQIGYSKGITEVKDKYDKSNIRYNSW